MFPSYFNLNFFLDGLGIRKGFLTMDKLRSRLKLMLGRKFGLNWLKMTTMDDRTSDFFCFNYNDRNYKWWCLFLVNPTILFMCPSFVHMKVELWCLMLDIFPKKNWSSGHGWLENQGCMDTKSRLHGYVKRGGEHIFGMHLTCLSPPNMYKVVSGMYSTK